MNLNSFFRKPPTPQKPAPMTVAAKLVLTLEAAHTTAEIARDAAAAKLDLARERLGHAQAAHRDACDAYAEDPDSRLARRVIDAKQAVELATIPVVKAEVAAASAQAEVAAASTALANARIALDAEKRAAKIAALYEATDVHALTTTLANHAQAAREHEEAARKERQAMVDAYEQARAAAAELRALGEPVSDLDPHLLLAPEILATVDAHPENVEALATEVRGSMHGPLSGCLIDPYKSVGELFLALYVPAFSHRLAAIKNTPTPSGDRATKRECLERALECRTLKEAQAIIDDAKREAEKPRAPAPATSALDTSHIRWKALGPDGVVVGRG